MSKIQLLNSKYIPVDKHTHFAQIYGAGWEFSLAYKIRYGLYKQIHDWATCRDFINDALYGFHNNVKATIYSFSYDPNGKYPLDSRAFRLLVRDKTLNNDDFLVRGKNALKVVRYFDKKVGARETRMRLSEPKDGNHGDSKFKVLLYEADKRWMNASPLASFYTFLLRAGMGYDEEKWGGDPETFIRKMEYKDVGCGGDISIRNVCCNTGAMDIILKHWHRLFDKDVKRNFDFSGGIGRVHGFGVSAWSSVAVSGCTHYCRGYPAALVDKTKRLVKLSKSEK